jgi:hypothetical protein
MNMRGDERIQDGMFSYVSLEQRVPLDHPLRAVRKLPDAVLRTLSPDFDVLPTTALSRTHYSPSDAVSVIATNAC